MRAIAKSAKRHPAAKKCCGWEEPAICDQSNSANKEENKVAQNQINDGNQIQSPYTQASINSTEMVQY